MAAAVRRAAGARADEQQGRRDADPAMHSVLRTVMTTADRVLAAHHPPPAHDDEILLA